MNNPESLISWRPVTADEPQPLVDVLLSVCLLDEPAPEVFMGWRLTDFRRFVLSGSDEFVPGRVFAYAPAPAPARVQEFPESAGNDHPPR